MALEKYDCVYLDIDNTLFSYTDAHNKGLQAVYKHLKTVYDIKEIRDFKEFKDIKSEMYDFYKSALRHDKCIFIKKCCEYLEDKHKINIDYYAVYNVYETEFLNSIVPFPGLIEFMERYKHKKVYLISNNLLDIQLKVVNKLGIKKYISKIYTSYEYQIEKPEFFGIVKNKNSVMIGDDIELDYKGALKYGLSAIHVTSNDHFMKLI